MMENGSVIDAVIESDPGLEGGPLFPVALVIPAPLRQWNVSEIVAPAITDPAAVPSFELSSAAWLAIVDIEPPAGGSGELTVIATGPPLVPAQTASAVECWYCETAMRRAWRAELVTASR
jgi:hypothetical protein